MSNSTFPNPFYTPIFEDCGCESPSIVILNDGTKLCQNCGVILEQSTIVTNYMNLSLNSEEIKRGINQNEPIRYNSYLMRTFYVDKHKIIDKQLFRRLKRLHNQTNGITFNRKIRYEQLFEFFSECDQSELNNNQKAEIHYYFIQLANLKRNFNGSCTNYDFYRVIKAYVLKEYLNIKNLFTEYRILVKNGILHYENRKVEDYMQTYYLKFGISDLALLEDIPKLRKFNSLSVNLRNVVLAYIVRFRNVKKDDIIREGLCTEYTISTTIRKYFPKNKK